MHDRIPRSLVRGTLGAAVLTVLLAGATPLTAQQRPSERPRAAGMERAPGGQERIEMRVQRLAEQLGLGAAQVSKVRALLQREAEQLGAIMEKNRSPDGARPDSAERQAMRAEMQKVRAATDAEIEKALDAGQREKYRALQADRSRRGPGGPPR